ncbi:MAG: SRPBCC family protein [Actinomycetota bacterium]|nr:SRPBCC family protein [Actinomycetota bacterium]
MTVGAVVGRGWPVVIENDIDLPAPPEIVWELITDWEHQDDWMLEASDFVVLGDQREGVGVRAAATISIGGIKTRDEIRVSRWEPPKLLAIEHLGWVKGTGELHLTPLNGANTQEPARATRLYWREELQPPAPLGALGSIGLLLFKPVMRRIFARDLRILAGLARVRASK